MAKRRLKSPAPPAETAVSVPTGQLNALALSAGFLGAAVVYVMYHPSDSVAVERGDALWLGMLSLVTMAVAWFVPASRLLTRLDFAVWLLAAWMMVAAWLSSPPGILRMATNEAWLWVTGAAIFTAVRRVSISPSVRRSMFALIVAVSAGLAVHGLYQYLISLPADRVAYRANPDKILADNQIDAPPGSAERMVFESRLFDGGPSATFALANSMAAVLLVGVLLSAGVLRFQWRNLSGLQRVVWFASMLFCAGCLMVSGSRSAILATFIGLAAIYVSRSEFSRRNGKAIAIGLGTVTAALLAAMIAIAQFGNREWIDRAPAWLIYRLHYWQSTWDMVVDRPLIGAGPGNFQAIYEQYRHPGMSEQISDPHNLVFETLGSGGFAAVAMLVVVVCIGIGSYLGRANKGVAVDTETNSDADSGRWVWLGAAVSLVLVWTFGWAVRQLPDVPAHLIVVPASVAFAWVLSRSLNHRGAHRAIAGESRDGDSADRDFDVVLSVSLAALVLHLLVSGGWTVPGVAILAWLFAGTLTRTGSSEADRSGPAAYSSARSLYRQRVALVGVTGCLAMVLYLVSLRPVQESQQLMDIAVVAQQKGQLGKAERNLRRAVELDPWSPDAVMTLANFYRWKAIMLPDRSARASAMSKPSDAGSSTARRRWVESVEETKRRAGANPAIYRALGGQQMHMFQRYGNRIDLDAANDSFRSAAAWSPVDHWLMAQRAVVESALENQQAAGELARQAAEMSQLGANLERHLALQHVYTAEKLGSGAEAVPVRRPAEQLLSELNPDPYRKNTE